MANTFASLSDRMNHIFSKLRNKGRLTELEIKQAMREIRVALLEADVNFQVVKQFVATVSEKALGEDILKSLSPEQQIIKIVNEELIELMGSKNQKLAVSDRQPTVYMMCGLQGAGKTTMCGKLALYLKKQNKKVLLVACDIYRPAAIQQLKVVAGKVGTEVFEEGQIDPVKIATDAIPYALKNGYDTVIIDTAGRLHIDEALMQELKDVSMAIKPKEVLLVVDAMSGQDSVNVAKEFNDKLRITGLVMSKLDGDARGGAALSIKHLTGIPIKFSGIGEKIDDIEIFYPERMAERILGMGDVLTLIEKAEEAIDEKEAKKTVNKMMNGTFTLDDMLTQMEQINKLGSMKGIMKFIPGMPKVSDEQMEQANIQLKKTKAVICSMTKEERIHPEILKANRKIRIAKGSGTQASDVNRVISQHEKMKEMMKQMKSMMKNGKNPFGV